MDLTISRRLRSWIAPLLALAVTGCGSDTPFSYSEDALALPGTIFDALPLATAQARAESPGAYVARMGGGFTVMDDQGRAWNHSFLFYAHEGRILRKITVHLIHGSPWVMAETVPEVPRPFADSTLALDSDSVVKRAVQLAPSHGLTLPSHYAARLSTVPAWPEPQDASQTGDVIAWRVDFLTLQPISGSTVYFSAARFYFDPVTGEELGVVISNPPELYPFP
jgi:hypothetical protein